MAPADVVVSAVVSLHPSAQPGGGRLDLAVAAVKAHFTSAGFEVHAPFARNFSIAARPAVFEEVFGDRLVIEERGLARSVTTEGGGRELPLEALPEKVRGTVESVAFVPPPEVAGVPTQG
ncbi:MAG: hypothetical protein ACRDZ9_09595 [Acidimicrobiales bacterium]